MSDKTHIAYLQHEIHSLRGQLKKYQPEHAQQKKRIAELEEALKAPHWNPCEVYKSEECGNCDGCLEALALAKKVRK